MQYKKSTIGSLLVILAVLGLFGINHIRSVNTGNSTPEEGAGSVPIGPKSPEYVTLNGGEDIPSLVSGKSGRLHVVMSIDPAAFKDHPRLKWNPNFDTVATAWVSVSRESGITFCTGNARDGTRCHTLVVFKRPEYGDASKLTTDISYSVDHNIRAGQYPVTFDVMAELVNGDGDPVQDVGILTYPVALDTHLYTKLLMLLTVAVAILLFVTEWVRIDVVAIIMMVLLPELGLLRPGEAFRGLSSNAVIAIIGVMIISYGLNRTGLVNRIIKPLLRFVRKGESRLVVVFSSLIAVISSVMQNTGAAVLFLPAIKLVANRELRVHVSRVLMPIGMAAILGGTLTMIGTSPLILLNDILPPGMPKFGFLELTPIGLALAVAGIAYLSTFGMKMLAARSDRLGQHQGQSLADNEDGLRDNYPGIEGPFELQVPANYRPGPGPRDVVGIRRRYMVNIVAVSKESRTPAIAPRPAETIEGASALCVYGSRENVEAFAEEYGLMLMQRPAVFRQNLFNPSYAGLAEMIIAPRSQFIGRSIKEIRFRETFDINALALHQEGEVYYRELADRKLQSGDAVLIHGTLSQIRSLKNFHQNFIIVWTSASNGHRPEMARHALFSFGLSLVLMLLSSFYFQQKAFNPIPLSICLMIGAISMVVTKVMTISEAYRSIDTRTVFLLGGLIPLGMAVDHTGTAAWLAKAIVFSSGGVMSPLALLIILAVLSCAFTMVVSNVGACALLVPLGISLANQAGIDPRVAAIVVGLGVSNSFILPTHQVNALYMGPGEYSTKDYIKIGGGLTVVYIAVLVAVTYLIYL